MIAHAEPADHDELPMADVDTARLWSASGCQAITHRDAAVPVRLVATTAGIVDELDAAGAGLGERFGWRGLGALSERAATLLFRRSGRESCGGGSRLLPARDGWVAVTLARPTDRELLPAWLGVDPGAACVGSNSDAWSEVARRIGDRPTGELVDSARELGLACAAVGECRPRTAVMRTRLGDATPSDLGRLRVVNLGSLWAGPLAANVLNRLGADVVAVESVSRPDGARQTPRWFDAMHAGQRSVALDFRDDVDVGRLSALLAAADVVIEGSRPRALEQLGIAASELVARGPRVWVSITGYGRDGGSAMRVGLGDDAAAAGRLVGEADGGPVFLADAVADPVTGLIAAKAIVEAVATGGRWLLDVALARAASAVAARADDARVNAQPDAAPGRPAPSGAPRFTLGADTDHVLGEWLAS